MIDFVLCCWCVLIIVFPSVLFSRVSITDVPLCWYFHLYAAPFCALFSWEVRCQFCSHSLGPYGVWMFPRVLCSGFQRCFSENRGVFFCLELWSSDFKSFSLSLVTGDAVDKVLNDVEAWNNSGGDENLRSEINPHLETGTDHSCFNFSNVVICIRIRLFFFFKLYYLTVSECCICCVPWAEVCQVSPLCWNPRAFTIYAFAVWLVSPCWLLCWPFAFQGSS